jgi:hypothetical protein
MHTDFNKKVIYSMLVKVQLPFLTFLEGNWKQWGLGTLTPLLSLSRIEKTKNIKRAHCSVNKLYYFKKGFV